MDVGELRELVAKASAAERGLGVLSAQAVADVKRRRAERYALRRERAREVLDASAAYLVFAVAGERLGVPMASVVSVVAHSKPQPLPLAPATVLGVLGFRGEPVLVISLHSLARCPAPAHTSRARYVVVRMGRGQAALIVDRVEGIRAVRPAEVEATGEHAWLSSDCLRGQLRDGVVLTDMDRLAEHLSRQDTPEPLK